MSEVLHAAQHDLIHVLWMVSDWDAPHTREESGQETSDTLNGPIVVCRSNGDELRVEEIGRWGDLFEEGEVGRSRNERTEGQDSRGRGSHTSRRNQCQLVERNRERSVHPEAKS
jgi:hypothetical protein